MNARRLAAANAPVVDAESETAANQSGESPALKPEVQWAKRRDGGADVPGSAPPGGGAGPAPRLRRHRGPRIWLQRLARPRGGDEGLRRRGEGQSVLRPGPGCGLPALGSHADPAGSGRWRSDSRSDRPRLGGPRRPPPPTRSATSTGASGSRAVSPGPDTPGPWTTWRKARAGAPGTCARWWKRWSRMADCFVASSRAMTGRWRSRATKMQTSGARSWKRSNAIGSPGTCSTGSCSRARARLHSRPASVRRRSGRRGRLTARPRCTIQGSMSSVHDQNPCPDRGRRLPDRSPRWCARPLPIKLDQGPPGLVRGVKRATRHFPA